MRSDPTEAGRWRRRIDRRAILRALPGATLAVALGTACSQANGRAAPASRVAVSGSAAISMSNVSSVGSSATTVATSAANTAGGNPTTLQLFYWGSTSELDAYKALQQGFHAHRPDITLQLNPLNGGTSYYEKLESVVAAGTPPDVFRLAPNWFATLADKGITRKLDDLAAANKFSSQDYFASLLESWRWHGALEAMPEIGNVLIVLYNVDLFQKLGLEDPNAADAAGRWTWEALLGAAQKLTTASGAGQFGFSFITSIQQLLPWVWSAGGQLFTDDTNPTKLDMSNPKTVDAFQWLADLENKYHVAPTPGETATTSAQTLFTTGRLGMLATLTNLGQFRQEINGKFNWDAANLPKGAAGRVNFVGGAAWGLAAATKTPEQGWAFLAYVGGPQGQQEYVKRELQLPVLQTLAGSEWLKLPAPPTHRQPLLIALDEARPIPKSPKMLQLATQVINPGLNQLWAGKASAQTIMASIDQMANGIIGAT